MSDYTGPGVYEMRAGHAPDKLVSAWGEGVASGTAVKLYQVSTRENQLWEVVAAGGDRGNPEIGDRQYHIIGVQSGLMLCSAEDGSDGFITLAARNVRSGSTRWKIIPAGNGNYYFATLAYADKWLAVGEQKTENGAYLMTYAKTEATHFQFILKKATF